MELPWDISLCIQYPCLVTGPSLGIILAVKMVFKVGRSTYLVVLMGYGRRKPSSSLIMDPVMINLDMMWLYL